MVTRKFKLGEQEPASEFSKDKLDKDEVELLNVKFSKYEKIMSESSLFAETVKMLKDHSITHIRCLALGSPSDSNAALYQLAYLTQICGQLSIKPSNVSLYDPVFNELDKRFLTTVKLFKISDEDDLIGTKTLYFLPHASLELTEQVLKESQPLFLLGNDIISHTDRLTKRKIHDTYRNISLLIRVLESVKALPKERDGFISVTAKKRKSRNKKPVFKEPEIEYNYDDCYFNAAELTRIESVQGVWGSSFSDIAFHHIIRNTTIAENQE
ncbi:uncharacterized protein AC631_00319 [Debaryomyces fabryi]|uniref:SRR1-like domain-containing protein n=1 Tax=Debaryomyces fabryi TaxID=58627 RepID=A0A0V1Q5U8_9ASCO|nr:uncharacterized protein AC631_00319 [Debaryomyces fabryi]KSA03864.1 hypothetical protein AC631_00319 [Debaryomyces fabryi]CUM48692.1 unnamed protein product [Debaryomyces fabryi]